MFEVGNKASHKRRAPQQQFSSEERLILPRPLRRMARFLGALVTGRVYIPRHTGSLSAVLFFAAVGGYGMSLGGQIEAHV